MRRTLLLVLILLSSGCVNNNLETISESRDVMGTVVTITVISDDAAKAMGAISSAFAEIERIDAMMSIYRNDSQLSLLNRDGVLENASPELTSNVERALYYANLSGGAFDVTVQPILDLYTRTYNVENRSPTEEEIATTLELVGHENIIADGGTLGFGKEGMRITLGGIAKGYAVDRAVGVLTENGIGHALVNAGGDMRAIGKKNSGDWQIALQDPRNKSNFITVISLDNMSVATSGDYERYFIDKKAHHIIDPKTGHSAAELMSVTIVTEKAMDADALATAVFVMGPEKGLYLIEGLDNVEGLLITENKTIVKSTGFQNA